MQRRLAISYNVKAVQRRTLIYTITRMLHHCKPFTQGRLRAPVMASNVCASLHMQERTQMSAASI